MNIHYKLSIPTYTRVTKLSHAQHCTHIEPFSNPYYKCIFFSYHLKVKAIGDSLAFIIFLQTLITALTLDSFKITLAYGEDIQLKISIKMYIIQSHYSIGSKFLSKVKKLFFSNCSESTILNLDLKRPRSAHIS